MLGVSEQLARMCLQLSLGAEQKIDIEAVETFLSKAQCNHQELSLDSRELSANSVFVALFSAAMKPLASEQPKAKQTSGHEYIEQAIQQGCTLVIAQTNDITLNNQVSLIKFASSDASALQILVFDLRQKLGALAKSFYFGEINERKPLPRITAITGTNGKTSVASLTAQWVSLLGEQSASIGTLGVNRYEQGAINKIADTINTTPDVVTLYSQLHKFRQQGITFVALEASSHGLLQNRLADIDLVCGVFTNLSQDHLDYHHTMQEYGAAKRRLLLSPNLQYMVLNANDPATRDWQQVLSQNPVLHSIQTAYFSVQTSSPDLTTKQSSEPLSTKSEACLTPPHIATNKSVTCVANNIRYTNHGCEFTLDSSWGSAEVTLPLIGKFNIENFLAAACALLLQGYEFSRLIAQVKNLSGVSGRMELFSSNIVHTGNHSGLPQSNTETKLSKAGRASILVDYAHTPDALQQALIAAKAHTQGQLICIFGCGGDRDKSKRQLMGQIAERFADKIVLTQDNSRTEKPEQIIADIQNGIRCEQKVEVNLDRKLAIKNAWQKSNATDLILLAGKGHETYMEINHKRIDYDEREYVSTLIKNEAMHQRHSNIQAREVPRGQL